MAKKKLVKGLWSKSEISLLKKLFQNNPTAKVAAQLGRPTEAVKKKASRMGLKKSKKCKKESLQDGAKEIEEIPKIARPSLTTEKLRTY